jgi:hypothetical protein
VNPVLDKTDPIATISYSRNWVNTPLTISVTGQDDKNLNSLAIYESRDGGVFQLMTLWTSLSALNSASVTKTWDKIALPSDHKHTFQYKVIATDISGNFVENTYSSVSPSRPTQITPTITATQLQRLAADSCGIDYGVPKLYNEKKLLAGRYSSCRYSRKVYDHYDSKACLSGYLCLSRLSTCALRMS